MKRFLGLALAALALSSCNRAPQESANAGPAPQDASPPPSLPSVTFTPETRKIVGSEEIPLLEQIDAENARVVGAALPSMVRITATRPPDQRMKIFGNEIPFQFPFTPGARRFSPPADTAYGSGIVISKDGYVLTNQHVIEGYSKYEVQLNDKRIFNARLVAADDLVDVAILKIECDDLAPLPWGDSDKVQVGQQVFAIGNPFDLDDSVSKGIVSAKGRNPEFQPDMHYEDYIQTDAAINPGNSGGALINIRGELIGLNAAIASTTRVSMGIGFAIPSNLVRYAVQGLLKDGHLVRGFLGVVLPDSVDDGVVNQLNLKTNQGAFLVNVVPDSPAAAAQLRSFDFITTVDGHKVASEAELRLVVAQIPVGKEIKIDFIREGKELSTLLTIGQLKPDTQVASNAPGGVDDVPFPTQGKPAPAPANVLGGVQVVDLNDKNRQKFSVESGVDMGVIVNTVQQGSPADDKGIQRGDVIESVSVNRGTTQNLGGAKDFAALTSTLKPNQGIVLLIQHQKGTNLIYLAPLTN